MAQRRTYSRSSGSSGSRTSSGYSRSSGNSGSRTSTGYSRTTGSSSYKKPYTSKYKTSKNPSRPPSYKSGGGGGAMKLVLGVLLLVVIVGGALLVIKNLPTATVSANSDAIVSGVTIDGIDVAGMTKDAALAAVNQAAQSKIENISITFRYNDKSWTFTSSELQAAVNSQAVVDRAYAVGRSSDDKNVNKQEIEDAQNYGLVLKTDISVDEAVLIEALKDVKNEIDQPMIEASIEFDPSNYNYFEDKDLPDQDLSQTMFTITPGSVGYVMDYEKALSELNDALNNGWTADITITVKEEHPKYTVEELQECTTLIYHSFSKNTHRDDTARNTNLAKALGYFKGMVIQPGELVSYNDVLGERTKSAGWQEANTITAEKTLEKALGGGICQIATTLYNAVFRADLKIIDRGPHSWPGYREDFGYGMDAMVNWGTDELIFQNDTEYPVFINTYYDTDSYGRLSYCDIDIYTMPPKDENGNRLFIIPESTITLNEDPPAPEYREATEGQYADRTWKYDATLNKEVYEYRDAKSRLEVSVDKIWCLDSLITQPGLYEGGVEYKREHDHNDTYAAVQAIYYTRDVQATPTPAPTSTPSP